MFCKKWAILAVAIAVWADSSRAASEEKEIVSGGQAYRAMRVAPGQLLVKSPDGSLYLGKLRPSGEIETKKLSSLMPVVSSTFEAWEGVVAGVHPQYFTGYGTIDPTSVALYRRAMDSSGRNPLKVTDGPLVRDGIRIFQTYAPGIAVPAGISAAEIYYACLVHAFSLSRTSDLEDDVFAHLPDNDGYHALQELADEKNHWFLQSSLLSLIPLLERIKDLSKDEKPDSFSHSYQSAADWELLKKTKSIENWHVLHPVNAGEMGLAFLPRLFMKDIYPIGLCREAAPVHGTNLSPGPMAVHDQFHGNVSRNGRRFREWAAMALDKALTQKVSARDFFERATPQMQRQYGLVMGIYDFVYQQTTALLMRGDEVDYKTMLVGFFLAMHEHPHFDPSMYNSHDAGDVLGAHLKKVRKALTKELSYNRHLKTDPVTGESPLTDGEIFEAFMPEIAKEIGVYNLGEYNHTTGACEYSKEVAKAWFGENVRDAAIKRSPYSISLKVELKSGKIVHASSSTNKKAFILNDDHRKVLGFLGQTVEKPTLSEDTLHNAKVVKAYYKSLRDGLIGVVDSFETRANEIMNPGIWGGPNFSEQYFEKSWDNHQEMKAVIADLKAEQEAAETPFWKLA